MGVFALRNKQLYMHANLRACVPGNAMTGGLPLCCVRHVPGVCVGWLAAGAPLQWGLWQRSCYMEHGHCHCHCDRHPQLPLLLLPAYTCVVLQCRAKCGLFLAYCCAFGSIAGSVVVLLLLKQQGGDLTIGVVSAHCGREGGLLLLAACVDLSNVDCHECCKLCVCSH